MSRVTNKGREAGVCRGRWGTWEELTGLGRIRPDCWGQQGNEQGELLGPVAMWEFAKVLPIFLIFQEKQIYTVDLFFFFLQWVLYLGTIECVCIYIYIIHMYMNYAQPTDIRVMLVGRYSINKFTNTETQGPGHPYVTSALGIHLARCCTCLSGKPEKSLRNRHHVKGRSHGNNLDSVTKS